MRAFAALLALISGILWTGCVVDLAGDDVGTLDVRCPPQDVARLSENKLSFNKLSFNKLSFNKLSFNKLSFNGLSGGVAVGSDAIAELEHDTEDEPGGYSSLVRYIVRCALPPGQSLRIPQPAEQTLCGSTRPTYHSYPGGVGVAESWLTGTCGVECQQWMTSCLVAHVNKLETEVAISLRGKHPALVAGTEELEYFVDQEAAFYGNLFVGQDPATTTLDNVYACTGWALQRDAALLAQNGTPGASQWTPNALLNVRLCGNPIDGGCPGIRVVAPCGYFPLWGGSPARACNALIGANPSGPAAGDGVYYDTCFDTAGDPTFHFLLDPPPLRFERVITTFIDTRGRGYDL